VRNLIGTAIKLVIRQGLVTTDYSHGVRRAPNLGLKYALETLIIGIRGGGGVPVHQQALAFISGQQGEL
jgi:hypothetical protein